MYNTEGVIGKMKAVKEFEKAQLKKDVPDYNIGDTVAVDIQVVEGDRIRTQKFEGVLIRHKKNGARSTITVRKASYGVGVERTFPIHSPRVAKITVVRKGRARRSRLYYLRKIEGKKARLKIMRKRK